MAITDQELSDIDDTIAKTASRGVASLTIGDRKIDYIDPDKLLQAKRALAEEKNGGIYNSVFTPKGYF